MYSNLNENSIAISQPSLLKIELMEHQKRAIYAMNKLEQTHESSIDNFLFYDNKEKNLVIDTKIGILGDMVGSGKSFMIASLLFENNNKKDDNYYYPSGKYFNVKSISETYTKINSNILVIPDHLEKQWIDVFKYTSYEPHIYINNEKQKDEYKVCIVTSKLFDNFMVTNSNVHWNRIIIDEADSIKINDYEFCANFIWLITGTPIGLANSKKKYLKNIFRENINWIIDVIMVKNNNDYVKKSLDIPVLNRHIIKCITPIELNIIGDFIPSSIKQMINAGNTDEAIKTLNCNIDTKDNIYKVITKSIENMIYNKQSEIDNEKKKKYNEYQLEQSKLNIIKIEQSIKNLKSRLNAIKTKIKESENICPICLGEIERDTLVDCCGTIYCFDCLILTNKTNKCAYCQQKINKKSIHIIKKKKENKESYDKYLDKMDTLLNIINEKHDGKILIFANYHESFVKIKNILETNLITHEILKNDKNIHNVINNFSLGKIKVLMLNANNFGSGLNLQCATDVIIYHRFTNEIEEQVIGRAQRFGRKTNLNVYYLIHNNEEKCFTEIFDSNDIELL
jgi:hypothetical protein